MCALYAITDIAIVTSLRDGMNLVSYEYVACQENKNGVLILSEFAGAAQSLGAGISRMFSLKLFYILTALYQFPHMHIENEFWL